MNAQTKIKARPKFTHDEVMAIGERANNKSSTILELAEEFAVNKSKIFEMQRAYRLAHGLPVGTTPRAVAEALAEQPAAPIAAPKKRGRKPRQLAPATGTELAVTDSELVLKLRSRIKELETELLHSEHELQVMQKLLYVAGERLL